MARVRVLGGSHRATRARRVDTEVRRHWGSAFLLVPTQACIARRTEELILGGDLPGAWGPPVMTFDRFAERLLRGSGVEVVRIGDLERRLLLETVVARLDAEGKLSTVGAAAKTAGFLNHIQRTIVLLKQAAIEPETFRARIARRANTSALDGVVADVYEGYQAALQGEGLYDLIGLFWRADVLCREVRASALADVALVALDGFDDFTPSEFRLLESLADCVDELVFGVKCEEADPESGDLYAVQRATVQGLVTRLGAKVEAIPTPEPADFISFATRHFQYRRTPPKTSALSSNLEVVPCPGAVAEVETIGRRVKSLIIDQAVPVEEIAVVYRDLGGVAPIIRSVFTEFGIPFRITRRPRLAETAVGAFLLDVVEATVEWPRDGIVDVLASPWFRPEGELACDPASTTAQLCLAAGISAKAKEWRQRLDWLRVRLGQSENDEALALLHRIPRAREDLAIVQARFDALEQVVGDGKKEQAVCAFIEQVEALLEACRIDYALEQCEVAAIREAAAAAVRAIYKTLAALRNWHEKHGDVEVRPRSELVACLRDAFRSAEVEVEGARGGVLCIESKEARSLAFRHVFLGGVNEGAIPQLPPASAIYSEQDLDELAAVDVVLEGRRMAGARESALFHEVLGLATERLVITWQTLGQDDKEARRSPYLEDLLRMFPECDIERGVRRASEFYPEAADAASMRDVRNRAFAEDSRLCELFREEFAQALEGARIEQSRYGRSPFDVFDGILADAALVEGIAGRFGDGHEFSAAQLETYLACPFRFFVERILCVAPMEDPASEVTDLEHGLLTHAILESFHNGFAGTPVAEMDLEEAGLAMDACIEEAVSERAERVSLPPGLIEVERRRLHTLLKRYLAIEHDADGAWRPAHFEVSFGEARRPSDDVLSKAEALVLDTSAGPLRIGGRIDRVDLRGEDARLVDYKTGAPPAAGDVRDGLSLQLALYALAFEECLAPGRRCAEAAFLKVGTSERRVCPSARGGLEWEDVKAAALERMGECVKGIRTGRFPPDAKGHPCRHCAVVRACRFEASRIERKRGGA